MFHTENKETSASAIKGETLLRIKMKIVQQSNTGDCTKND